MFKKHNDIILKHAYLNIVKQIDKLFLYQKEFTIFVNDCIHDEIIILKNMLNEEIEKVNKKIKERSPYDKSFKKN